MVIMLLQTLLMWKSNHTSCTLCLSLYVHNKSTSEIFFKLWKIINLKTLLKNEKELKRTKVRSIRKQAGKICGGCWRIFAQKNFYQDKRVILQLEIWKGAVNYPIRSRGQGFEKKNWKFISPRLQEVKFPGSWA